MSRVSCEWCDSDEYEWYDEELARCLECGEFFSPDLDRPAPSSEWQRHPVEFKVDDDDEC